MDVPFRFSALAFCLTAFMTLFPQNPAHDPILEGVSSGKTRVIDLSYAISDKLVAWPGDEKAFEAKANATVEKDGYFTRSFWMLEHYGTHLDAPAHFPPGKATVDQIPANKFFGPAVVIDVRAEAAKDADYRLTVARVEEWEKHHGRIPEGAKPRLAVSGGLHVRQMHDQQQRLLRHLVNSESFQHRFTLLAERL